MGSFSIWHWLVVLAIVLLLFGGRGKLSQIMGDFGKGLKSFKKSMKDDESFEEPAATSTTIEPKAIPQDAPPRAPDAPQPDRAARS